MTLRERGRTGSQPPHWFEEGESGDESGQGTGVLPSFLGPPFQGPRAPVLEEAVWMMAAEGLGATWALGFREPASLR